MRYSRLFGLIFLATLAMAQSASPAAPPQVKLATLAPKGTTYHQYLLEMGEKWAAAPDGGVKLTIYLMKESKHAFPESEYPPVREWLRGPGMQ